MRTHTGPATPGLCYHEHPPVAYAGYTLPPNCPSLLRAQYSGFPRKEPLCKSGSFHSIEGGLNLAAATGRQQETGANYAYLKLGLKRRWNDLGETALSLDVFEGDDLAGIGSQSTSYGIGIVQKWERYNTELYAGYRSYELKGAAVAVEDINVAVIGARWKF